MDMFLLNKIVLLVMLFCRKDQSMSFHFGLQRTFIFIIEMQTSLAKWVLQMIKDEIHRLLPFKAISILPWNVFTALLKAKNDIALLCSVYVNTVSATKDQII